MARGKNNIITNNTKWLWIVTIFVLVIFIAILAFVIFEYSDLLFGAFNVSEVEKVEKKDNICQDCARRYIDGVYVKSGEENLFPVAVIIENHVDARPQYGLTKANLVFEAEAEGGITRFLAVYAAGEEIKKIGPIRSARPYFVDWAKEFSALFAHCGGSPEALAKIAKENIFDINEFYNEKYFWRDENIGAPHNIFTSSGLLDKYLEEHNINEGKYLSWSFKEDEEFAELNSEASELSSDKAIEEITVNFQLPEYVVKWKYDRKNNEYIRYNGGKIHKDTEGNEIRVKNVIIEYVEAEVIDEELRLKMEHIGEGKAVACLDGKCEEGEWRKKTGSTRTRFYKIPPLDKEGEGPLRLSDSEARGLNEEFKFNAGATWVEVVRPEYEINY